MTYRIPFNRPCLAGNEYKYIVGAIANGHASGDGPFTRRCHEFLEKELGVPKALLTTSCTHALEMAALLLDCGPATKSSFRRLPLSRLRMPSPCGERVWCSRTFVPTR